MRKSDKVKMSRKADEEAIYKASLEKTPQERVKDLPLEDIFMVVTRQGAETFIPMIENSMARVVDEIVDKKLREVAAGMMKGMEANTGTVTSKEQILAGMKSDLRFEDDNTEDHPYEEMYGPKADDEEWPASMPKDDHGKVHSFTPKKLDHLKKQKNWTKEEDETLVAILKSHIRRKKTKTKAFQEAGSTLDRTAAACGYRWNKVLSTQPWVEEAMRDD